MARAPGSTEVVNMSTHEVTLQQRPSIGVLVDGQQVATLQLGLSIVFDVDALVLGISGGRLVTVHSGNCDITATLAIQGTDVFVRNAHIELPGVVSLRRGIRLLSTGQYPPGEYTGSGPRDGEYTGGGHQVSEHPEGVDPSAPWWPFAQSVPPPDHRA
jgi:hypothetical protein